MAILSNGKFYGFLCSVKATGRKLSNGVKEYVEDFVSGFAGHGWKLWEYIKGKWKLEIDALLVRGQFTVFELLISKIRSIMGAQTISQGQGKVKSARISDDGTEYLIELEDEDVSLVAHDFIRCQTFSGTDLRMYHVEIESVDLLTKTLHIPLSEFNLDDSGNVLNPPKAGDDLVQFGNSQNKARQSAIYLHADENGQPAIDVMFDIDSKDWTNKIKIRVGGDIPGTEGLKGFYSINGMIKAVDENGALIYGLYPDGTVNIGKGNIVYNPQNNKVTLGSGVTLSWSNLDEEAKENLKGLPGKYTELRYKYAFGKPATPTGTNPAGWSLSPDREDITFSYSGNFTKDGDYYVSPSPTSHSSTYKQRVSFTTRRANQMIHIEIDVSSEQNYDKGIVEALDTSYSSSNEHAWEGSGVTNAVVDIAVPTAGSHFVEIVYTKDSSTSSNEDRVKFRMLDPTTCWYSTAVIDGKTTPSWSEPVIFPTDSKTEEQVYLLAKSKRNVIDLPASNEYVNEYIGDAPEYSSSKFYSAGNIVKYNDVYKVAIQAHSGIAPTNETYWEDVFWWVDNPRGASETYPYEYTCERTLQDGKWGEYKNYRLFGHYGKDGEPGADGKPGEDGKDANLLPWVEQWNNNKTLIDGEYIVSPKMFSGTKDSGGKLTGIALGRDCITIDGEKRTGIFALVKDEVVFELDPINQQYKFKGTIEADSGKIGEWNITSTGLAISGQSNANIYLNINGGKFLRINPTEALMFVRNDEGNGIWVTTYGGGDALKVLSNGSGSKYGYAIDSAGNHRFYQRDGDIWNAPGVLWAAYIRGSDGFVMRSWGDGCTTGYVGRSAAGDYVINHNLGDKYFPFATAVHGVWSIASLSNIASGSFHVRTFHKDGNYGDSDFFVAIMGRNRG